MAHEIYFPLDVLLRFSPKRMDWIESEAAVDGWVNDEEPEDIRFSVPVGSTKYVLKVDLRPWDMTLPSGLEKVLEGPDVLPNSDHLRREFSDFKVPCLVGIEHGSEPAKALAGKDSSLEFLRERRTSSGMPKIARDRGRLSSSERMEMDPWEIRREFFRCQPTIRDFRRFLNKWGRWDYSSTNVIPLFQLVEYQKECLQAVTQSPERWLRKANIFALDTMPRAPYFVLDIDTCRRAIAATITIDLLREVKFRLCARRDCGVPFEITSKHKRKFCSQRCAHVESVRKGRREAKVTEKGR